MADKMNNEKSNQLRDLTELILRHDERMNELQITQQELKNLSERLMVNINRHDRELEEHRTEFKEFIKWAKESREESNQKFSDMQVRIIEAQKYSHERMDRIEKNLNRLIEGLRTGGRNGRD
jgi:hypothetical protein